MIKDNDMKILTHLRKNSRISLTNLSKQTSIPISTIFEKIKQHEKNILTKHTTLIDFAKIGYSTRANINLAVAKDKKEDLKQFLKNHSNVNTAYKITNGFDFAIEAIFKNLYELENFHEDLDDKFKIKKKSVNYIIEEIKKEDFMANPDLLEQQNL